MAGAIIENMSTKKLVIVGVTLLLFQAFAFMVGGLIAPSPTTAVHYLATKCVDTTKHRQETKWFMPWGPNQCDKIRTFDEAMAKKIEANNIVFAVHIPLPNKEMSPWFQFMLVILQFDIAFKMYNQIEDGSMATIDVGLAYRDDTVSEWTEMAHSFEQRKLTCNFTTSKTFENEGRYYECDLLPFMEVGSVAHKYYLLNIRLPVNERKKINVGIGEIKDIRLVSIHQNGGFTKVWFAMKTFLTPSILIIMIWYWRRITLMSRPPVLLEKVILALGISMTFINIPVEWFSVGFNWTWMLLFGDIRQGIFYSMLLSFWIIFCGEHLMDQTERNRFSVYWKQVGPIVFGSFCLFIFDMCERGVQLTNPFYSIWASDVGTELAMAFIIVAGICACLYFLFLCFMVFQVFRNISGKRTSLPAMSKARRLHYEGLIFRFKFLMLVTLTCAAMTVIFFIISQVNEGHWHWGEHTVQVNSAFFTGIYGMWNLYVFAIMFLYAPSHKRYGDEQSSGQCITGDAGGNSGEDIQLTTTITHVDGPSEIYKMTGKEAQE
ncbi:protein wntless homolog isoform X3 [Morone saxatilis]|uniref:protein wntless homolog isoform X3 n=1 Tax=Morone saxatilis TaxID=34816 RepID=UPI0015E22A9A|nr:protein wntless homolog isoform X3 [Morone saxatilis]